MGVMGSNLFVQYGNSNWEKKAHHFEASAGQILSKG